MGEPDFWVRTVKQVADEDWSMKAMASALCDRRYSEATVGYVESHDQALVGDQTLGGCEEGSEGWRAGGSSTWSACLAGPERRLLRAFWAACHGWVHQPDPGCHMARHVVAFGQ